MTQLEDYRHNELGTAFFILQAKPGHKVYLSYEHHVTKAFYYTLNDIINLENSKLQSLSSGAQTHSSISFWFLALESYINVLVKLCCLKKGQDFAIFKQQDLNKRLSSLVDLLDLDKKAFNSNRIFAKVNEFCQYRNELFHDRNFGNRIKFDNTDFSEIPFLSNQVDTFQSILIFLEVTKSLRFCIEGLDTMPSAVVKNQEFAAWEKVDYCYNGILKPSLEAALDKHNLSVRLDLNIPICAEQKSSLFKKGEILCLLTAEQENHFFVEVNDTPTHYCNEIYHNFLKQYDYKKDTFRIAKVMLD